MAFMPNPVKMVAKMLAARRREAKSESPEVVV